MIFRAEDEEYLTHERLMFTRDRGSRNDIEQVKFREQKKIESHWRADPVTCPRVATYDRQ